MGTDEAPEKSLRRRKMERLLITCNAFGLTRPQRIELANHLIFDRGERKPPIESFNDLDDVELDQMLNGMDCAALVAHICLERKAGRKKS